MRLLKRMSGLVTANLNDLIDQCEDPEKMLRQAVRDMETALGQLMDGAAMAIAHHKLISRQLNEERDSIEHCTTLAQAAVARSDDNAARRALLRKVEHVQLAQSLAKQLVTAEALDRRLRRQVTAMRIKLGAARRKLIDVAARGRAAAAQRKFVEHLPSTTITARTWSNFSAMCVRIDQSEAETEALLDLLGEDGVDSTLDTEIEAELRTLKEAAHHVTC